MYTEVKKNFWIYFNLFWLGFLIYSLGSVIMASKYLDIKICQAIQGLGIVLILSSLLLVIRIKKSRLGAYIKVVFTFYICWLLVIVVRGADALSNYDSLKKFLFDGDDGMLIYIAPMIVLFPQDFQVYKKIFTVIFSLGILFLLLSAFFIQSLLYYGDNPVSLGLVEQLASFSIPAGFILMTSYYHSRKRNLISVGILLLSLFFAVVRARRGLIFIISSVVSFSFLLNFLYSKKKIVLIYLTIMALVLSALFASHLYKASNNRILGFLLERGTEDTRSNVELCFYDDMKTDDWIFGKGANGQYFCPNIEENQITNYRSIIETGYLQIILKGGIISLSLLLLIMIPACIKGLFFSRNILSKAAGIWIFLFLLKLYPQTAISFDLSYLLVWISVGICLSRDIGKVPDKNLKYELAA